MKQGLHPTDYRLVVVEDISNGERFLTKSTAKTEETTKWEDGNEYPLVKVHISSTSHPFYTGQEKLVDVEGRVDRFKARSEAAKKQKDALAKKAQKKAERGKKAEDNTQTKIGDRQYNVKPKAEKSDKPESKRPEQSKESNKVEQKTEETKPESTKSADLADKNTDE